MPKNIRIFLLISCVVAIVLIYFTENKSYYTAVKLIGEDKHFQSIEYIMGDSSAVAFPDVHKFSSNNGFIYGFGSGNYIGGPMYKNNNGEIISEGRIYFIINKSKMFKSAITLILDEQSWQSKCNDLNLPIDSMQSLSPLCGKDISL